MGLVIELHEQILKKITNIKDPCSGFLYGISTNSKVLILSLELKEKRLIHSLPVGFEICGVFQIGQDFDKSELKKSFRDGICKNPVVISLLSNDKQQVNVQVMRNDHVEKADYQIVSDDKIYAEYIFVRCKGNISIKCEFTAQSIKERIQSLKNQLDSDSRNSKIIFKVHKNSIFFLNNNVIGCENEYSTIFDLYKDLHMSGDDLNKKQKSQLSLKRKVLDFDMLLKLTNDEDTKSKAHHAPVCTLNKNSVTALDTVANIDVLAMVPLDQIVSDLHQVLVKSVVQYLDLFEISLKRLEGTHLSVKFETFHFLPEDLPHFITVLYLNEQSEEVLKPLRQSLHKQLLLDQIFPRFRRSNKYLFDSEMLSNGPLINPHETLRPTDNGGELALVRGKYQYYHYCQNNMDDNGWGCAYRSLQTLASWFKLQGYVNKDVPTFQDIQKCLVDIKDKPANFLGSRQWIGSTEVSFVLNSLLGIDCKILFVSSGEEMGTKGPELVNHFRTQGSPIMIGGGVLAHTILGVDYNQSTGKLKFLILDPHYTGGEDIHTIQSKGWCGWKGLDFWNKTAYYNMCLPQVPRGV